MTCDEVKPLLGAFFDNEVTEIELSQKIQSHLETCEVCAKELATMSHVSASIRSAPRPFEMPAGLEAEIRLSVSAKPGLALEKAAARSRTRALTGYLAIAAILIFATALLIVWGGRVRYRIEDDLVADHVRSLQANHLFDVPSTDQHTVKPWFQGKLDFSPSVPQLAAQGFPLLGGRLDYFANRPAAALVYSRAKHVINVFVVRHSTAGLSDGVVDRNGYHVIAWQSGGLDYWAVSDVNPADLRAFKASFLAGS